MATNLDKISNELEDSLERARVLAEQRQQSQIFPFHVLSVLLENKSPLVAMLEKAGVACGPLLDSLAGSLGKDDSSKLQAGRRPTASRSLRDLLEKAFLKMEQRGAEMAEPIDFVLAAVEFVEEHMKGDLRKAGFTKQTAEEAVDVRAASPENTVQVELPAELVRATNLDKWNVSQEAARLIALELFREGKVSLGRAAELCRTGLAEFMAFAGRHEVSPIRYGEEELEQDRRTFRELGL